MGNHARRGGPGRHRLQTLGAARSERIAIQDREVSCPQSSYTETELRRIAAVASAFPVSRFFGAAEATDTSYIGQSRVNHHVDDSQPRPKPAPGPVAALFGVRAAGSGRSARSLVAAQDLAVIADLQCVVDPTSVNNARDQYSWSRMHSP
jgi:hypothetical protein